MVSSLKQTKHDDVDASDGIFEINHGLGLNGVK